MGNGLDTHVARSRALSGLSSCLVTRHGRREQSVAAALDRRKRQFTLIVAVNAGNVVKFMKHECIAVKPSLRLDQYEKPAWNPKS
jgi:hypothetical protein